MTSPLSDILEREFCPPLDSSLILALIGDIDENPCPSQIDALRANLQVFAKAAETDQINNEMNDLHLEDSVTASTLDSGLGENTTTTSSSFTSDYSDFNPSSPLGFLQAALPHVSSDRLRSALSDAQNRGSNWDMWEVIADILSEEWIREVEERGLDYLDEENPSEVETSWETVTRRSRGKSKQANHRNGKEKPLKVALADIRQQHKVRRPQSLPPASSGDPWSQMVSIADYASTLLLSTPPSFFMSHFHDSKYSSPYLALLAALSKLSSQASSQTSSRELKDNLLDILTAMYETENPQQLSEELEICLAVTAGREGEALDLVKLLRDLERDSSSGEYSMGIYHSSSIEKSSSTASLPDIPRTKHPTPVAEPRATPVKVTPTPTSSNAHKPSPYQWQRVPERKAFNRGSHPLAAHIPAYSRDVNGVKVKGTGNSFGKGGKGDVGELGLFRQKMSQSMRKRDDLLLQAAKMWQKGNSKSRGGEIALYYAERARDIQRVAEKEALDASRMMVEAKRTASGDKNVVDVHGTTSQEAIVIVKEILSSGHSNVDLSTDKPLKIVTGRGSHSANHVSVLKPAIKSSLQADGWSVGTWDAGLLVHRKQPNGII